MSEEHIYVTRGFSLNIPSSSHEGEFRWSCLPTFEAGGPERSPRVKDPLLLPGRSLKKMNMYILTIIFFSVKLIDNLTSSHKSISRKKIKRQK